MVSKAYVVKYGLLLVVSSFSPFILVVVEDVELDLFLGFLLFKDRLLLLNGGFAPQAWHQRVRPLEERVQRVLEVRVRRRIFFFRSSRLREGWLYWC